MACTTSAVLEVHSSFSKLGFPRSRNPCFGRHRKRSIIGAESASASARSTGVHKPVNVVANPRNVSNADLFVNSEEREQDKAEEYDWEQEWYPMYLVSEMPKSAPLGLIVFDKPLVLFYDEKDELHCFEDRCPHRSAKLSEGQVTDGKLECLYHGWQFDGTGQCTKIPQLVPGAKIPKQACAKSYAVKNSQGVAWAWLGDKATANADKLPWFELYAQEGFQHVSAVHELPYDYSILLENLMDPAHIPISHDRTDPRAKRENAQALVFELTERTSRGFAGNWKEISSPECNSITRFEAPCSLRSDLRRTKPDGTEVLVSALFLCRPTGQGKCMLIARFGSANFPKTFKFIPSWFIHKTSNTIFEQDMGFLASQNELLVKENRPTKELYLNLKSSDTWVTEFRKWNDRVGHGMPHYFGHHTTSQATKPAITEAAPAGASAAAASSYPPQGSFGAIFARDSTNRYFRHVVHCKACLSALHAFQKCQKIAVGLGLVATGVAITFSSVKWRALCVAIALLALAAAYVCSKGIAMMTQNYVRPHRK